MKWNNLVLYLEIYSLKNLNQSKQVTEKGFIIWYYYRPLFPQIKIYNFSQLYCS